jgi:hypothetical protein
MKLSHVHDHGRGLLNIPDVAKIRDLSLVIARLSRGTSSFQRHLGVIWPRRNNAPSEMSALVTSLVSRVVELATQQGKVLCGALYMYD